MHENNKQGKMFPIIKESDAIYERAASLIPAGTQTLAKGPSQYVNGIAPKYLLRGRGCRVWDADENEYLDYNMGIGPISLGYCNPVVDDAIRKQLENGITFSLMHPLEVEVAELIHEQVPNAENVRFSKAGNDVTSAAVRLARAYTGRDVVLCCGYHGWHDWHIAVTDRNRGIPGPVAALTYTIPYNDIEELERAMGDDVACLILEPVAFEEPSEGYLSQLKTICERNGTLLIFDEMWTGFRLAHGGAQEYYGVTPHLACFSKAIANGMPLSVLTGRADVMRLLEREVFFYTTFGGETLSLAAASATIRELKRLDAPSHFHKIGGALKSGINELIADLGMTYVKCIGPHPRTMLTFDPAAGNPLMLKSLLQQELIRRGILWSGFQTISMAHTVDDVSWTLDVFSEALNELRDAVAHDRVESLLCGKPVEAVFRRTSGFNTRSRR